MQQSKWGHRRAPFGAHGPRAAQGEDLQRPHEPDPISRVQARRRRRVPLGQAPMERLGSLGGGERFELAPERADPRAAPDAGP